ncbi:2Fe-2S iron-sulfur cluster binding domain-containing protein, partial [Pseudomonas aeruginosa]|nr:2Fe-2S iron-sulfur cluster binding domain-containing protein [Pseudomonas aeruginosa]
MIRFLLNREIRVEERLDPNLTVLDYLRRHLGKTGTKEGCASGDCGACTVVVGELVTGEDGAERIRYRSLNSCLTFVSALHGKQLITVEDLKQQNPHCEPWQSTIACCT